MQRNDAKDAIPPDIHIISNKTNSAEEHNHMASTAAKSAAEATTAPRAQCLRAQPHGIDRGEERGDRHNNAREHNNNADMRDAGERQKQTEQCERAL
eukprot:CAMPEP_0172519612 /NCGR_PEP_ID=MMETSP1066-20121228/291520_1 /TAXON_ID=671091 /ORGANISM="Coscinodiscus wailesii, Strain CCMP2513" /LENGTH=96 /DNA_ID=CAMNT_0013302235 /DNA_START=738 /DNA_END=1028 /DNA_ORIENTATION=-